jgi:hypothetical protein
VPCRHSNACVDRGSRPGISTSRQQYRVLPRRVAQAAQYRVFLVKGRHGWQPNVPINILYSESDSVGLNVVMGFGSLFTPVPCV